MMSKAEQIAEAGAITPLVNLLSGLRGDDAQEAAANALRALAGDSSNRLLITESGGIGPLVLLLGCANVKAREHAEAALAATTEHPRGAIVSGGTKSGSGSASCCVTGASRGHSAPSSPPGSLGGVGARPASAASTT